MMMVQPLLVKACWYFCQAVLSECVQAIKEGRKRFVFLGQDIRLIPTCGIFVTMNPGYAGKVHVNIADLALKTAQTVKEPSWHQCVRFERLAGLLPAHTLCIAWRICAQVYASIQ